MELIELYSSAQESGESGDKAREMLKQTHWFASFAEFDPKTGEALPLPLTTLLRRIAAVSEDETTRDRLWIITDYSRASVERLFHLLSENPRRESAYLPIRAVRELDTASFIALSRRPGRNIREKLADKPYMQAIRRFQSVDLPENQLLKAFVTRLAELLDLRRKYLNDEDILLQRIYKWLNTEEAHVISRWQNLPPNNTLLSHREYRRIWNAWRWLQTLDDDTECDFQQFEKRRILKSYWDGYAHNYKSGSLLLAEMPVFFDNKNAERDYGSFDVRPWVFPMPERDVSLDYHRNPDSVTDMPVCVDLSYVRPRFASDLTTRGVLDSNFIWQRWQNDDALVDIDLFSADVVYLHEDATTISSYDLFFPSEARPDLLSAAAHSFALKLNSLFKSGWLIWITPDCLSDFELELLRRNLNSRFANAEPLPCSVATVVESIKYTDISKEGFSVAVLETINSETYATEMLARFDKELLERLPETCGYIWERGAPEFMSADAPEDNSLNEICTVDVTDKWINALDVSRGNAEADDIIIPDSNKRYDLIIKVNHSPVCGGIKLYRLQQLAGDIPLWRNHIPELSIKVLVQGRYQPFFLVDKGITVSPVRGQAVSIPVKEVFTLPAGQSYYRFPLFQGADESALEYEARLESPEFPLKADLSCHLNMTYTYGADDPYRLVFEPINNTSLPIVAKWQPKSEVIITDASAPGYPQPLTWAELQSQYNPVKQTNSDLLDWHLKVTEYLVARLNECSSEIIEVSINSDWRTDKNNNHYVFADAKGIDSIFIHQNALEENLQWDSVEIGDSLYITLDSLRDKPAARKASKTRDGITRNSDSDIRKYISKALYVPYIMIWKDSRSVYDAECPAEFRSKSVNLAERLCAFLQSKHVSKEIKIKLVFLLCCMHKDMPDRAKKIIFFEDNDIEAVDRSLGFAIGDLSQEWQRQIAAKLFPLQHGYQLRTINYAIWRCERFVHYLSEKQCIEMIDFVHARIKETNNSWKTISQNNESLIRAASDLELLFAMLRTRESANPEIKMLLQPHQEITQSCASEVDALAEKYIHSGKDLSSRLQLDVSTKPEDDKTPDLLYALRVYLTGDDSANAIRVTGISDDD